MSMGSNSLFRKSLPVPCIIWACCAGMMNAKQMPYHAHPLPSGLGTDVVEKTGFPPELRCEDGIPCEKLIVIDDPFGHKDDEVVLLPALTPDVSIIHAQQVSTDGTVRIRGLTFADLEQCKAASAVIVTCEAVSYTHLRLPTIYCMYISVEAVSLT